MIEFESFPKLARLKRNCIISEKIDGTNAQIIIDDDFTTIAAASRTKLITINDDNMGFARWVQDNKEELLKLGPGRHFGEWWGAGIQRRYGLKEKRFSLFNSIRWTDEVRPNCCYAVPILYSGIFSSDIVETVLADLQLFGSKVAPGFMKPEGVVIWHEAAQVGFKVTLEKDEVPKGMA